MLIKSLGFIGGSRMTRIILGGLKSAVKMPEDVCVSDVNNEVLQRLKNEFPEIAIVRMIPNASSFVNDDVEKVPTLDFDTADVERIAKKIAATIEAGQV